MLIFGYGPRAPKDRGAVAPLQCANCGNVTWYDLVTQRSWFSLFFVPVFPVRTTDALVCTTCQHAIPLGRPAATAAIDMVRTTERHRNGQLDAMAYGQAVDAFWQRVDGRVGPGRTPEGASWWSAPSGGPERPGADSPSPAAGAPVAAAGAAAVGGGLLSTPIVRPPAPPPAPPDPFAPTESAPPAPAAGPTTPAPTQPVADPAAAAVPGTDSTAPLPAADPAAALPPPDLADRRPDPPAGWYADPHGAATERYWDGSRWTNATR